MARRFVDEAGAEATQPSKHPSVHAEETASASVRTPDLTAAALLPSDSQQPVSSAGSSTHYGDSSAADADSPTMEPHRVASTPAVRRLAKELGVDINRVPGTGPNGRVVRGVSQTEGVRGADMMACFAAALVRLPAPQCPS